MPTRLKRYYGFGHLHFLTFSCYQRRPLLEKPEARTFFVLSLNEIRCRYKFRLIGYVVMPEHVHMLVSEPFVGDLSVVLKALKFRVSRDLRGRSTAAKITSISPAIRDIGKGLRRFWEVRFYDFNVYTEKKEREKLDYMHANPVTRGLVVNPLDWIWSSCRFYEAGERGMISIDAGE